MSGGGGASTNALDPCSYVGYSGAECQQPPGLWPNGEPIIPGVSVSGVGFGGGGGGFGTSPLSGDFGPLGYASGSGWGLPCDFGTCGSGAGGEAFTGVVTLPGVVFHVTSWGSLGAVAATGALAGLDLGLLGYDLYQGYRLAQAYGHFLPKPVPAHPAPAVPVAAHGSATGSDYMDALQQYIEDLKACTEQYPPGPGRQDCFKRAKAVFDLRTGKTPGPAQ
jgi:hypothetical protein